MPAFSTTTASDEVVTAIIMMGSMQKYFSYEFALMCGIPSVTLLGEREDWALMVTKLAQLAHLGAEPARFTQLLRPVLNNFVASFDNPESPDTLSFWSKCADRRGGGSGPTHLTGWLMYEKEKPKCAKKHKKHKKFHEPPQVLDWSLVRQGK